MIQKRGNRWRVVVQAPRDELTRRRHQLSGSALTEREAVALERSLRLQVERGGAGRTTLAEVVEDWWQSPLRLAPTTLANYRQNLDRHILPHLGSRRIEEIRPRVVAALLAHVADQGLAGGTVRKVRTVLSAVMTYAVAMEYAESNPVMKVPPPPADATVRVAPTIDEAAQILLTAERIDATLRAMLAQEAESGGVARGISNSLDAKLNAGEAALARGQADVARNNIEAFRSELWAQRGKKVTEAAYLRLDGGAARLLTRL